MLITTLSLHLESFDQISSAINDIESCGGKIKSFYQENTKNSIRYSITIEHDEIFFSYFIKTNTFKSGC